MAKKDDHKDIHFVDNRPYGERSRYDPEEEIPDPEQVDRDIDEVEEEYSVEETRKKGKKPAA
jgi:uncharacterized protein YjbK